MTVGFVIIHACMGNLIVMGLVEVLTGLTISPVLASGNLVMKETVPEESLTEGSVMGFHRGHRGRVFRPHHRPASCSTMPRRIPALCCHGSSCCARFRSHCSAGPSSANAANLGRIRIMTGIRAGTFHVQVPPLVRRQHDSGFGRRCQRTYGLACGRRGERRGRHAAGARARCGRRIYAHRTG